MCTSCVWRRVCAPRVEYVAACVARVWLHVECVARCVHVHVRLGV